MTEPDAAEKQLDLPAIAILQPPAVHLNTYSCDGEYALANYQARGFSLYRTEKGA